MKQTIDLRVDGMTCDNCVEHVTNALKAVSGVKRVKVDLEGGSAEVTTNLGVTRQVLTAVVDSAGYQAH